MKKNVGTVDMVIRLIIAVIIAVLYYTETITGTLGMVLLVVAGVMLFTGIVRFCPLYRVLGMNTCPKK